MLTLDTQSWLRVVALDHEHVMRRDADGSTLATAPGSVTGCVTATTTPSRALVAAACY